MKTYDYIVVGAGSAGCVVTHRLSADPSLRVLMIEAGSTARNYLVPMPFACGRVFYNAKLNWGFETEPEPFADNRVLTRAAGKVLGGGSSINGMLYTRGHHRDYDQWAQLGCSGWAFSDVLPYFKRSETNWRGATPVHGGDGPLSVSRHMPDKIYAQIAESARRLGYRVTDDFERDAPDGFGIPDFTTHRGRRGSTAKRYIDPIGNRRNLTIETGAQVTRLLLEGRRAVGVEYAIGGQLKQVRADRELVLSAGTYNSPKLLMLSGIGPADDLAEIGVKPIHDLPGVGRNLQEHPGAAITYRSRGPLEFDARLRLDKLMMSVLQWQFTGRGDIASLPFTAMAFCRSRAGLERPDVELLFTPAALDARIWFPGWRKPNGRTHSISSYLLHPYSRGWVKLRSPDPSAPPRILLNLLAEQSDRNTFLRAFRMVREFMASEPASLLVETETAPGLDAVSDEALLAYIRRVIRTAQHPTSTCAMGTGPDAVVDSELRVRGLYGLRVIDASIMPIIVSGHTNAPTIMIGERGADLVLGKKLAAAALPVAAA